MAANLKVYPGKTFTAQDFAVLMERISIIKSGIISGCVVEANSASVSITDGYAVVRGRLVQISAENITNVPSSNFYVILTVSLTTGDATLYLSETLPTDAVDFNTSTATEGVEAHLCLATVTVSGETYTVAQELSTEEGQIRTIEIPSSAWVAPVNNNYEGYYYTLTDNRITTTSHQEVLPPEKPSKAVAQAVALADIHDGGQTAGSMTLVCYGVVPRISISLRVLFRGAL